MTAVVLFCSSSKSSARLLWGDSLYMESHAWVEVVGCKTTKDNGQGVRPKGQGKGFCPAAPRGGLLGGTSRGQGGRSGAGAPNNSATRQGGKTVMLEIEVVPTNSGGAWLCLCP